MEYWKRKHGMMECCSDFAIFQSSMIPLFQCSNIPLFHSSNLCSLFSPFAPVKVNFFPSSPPLTHLRVGTKSSAAPAGMGGSQLDAALKPPHQPTEVRHRPGVEVAQRL